MYCTVQSFRGRKKANLDVWVSPIIDGNVIYIEIVLPDTECYLFPIRPATSIGIVSIVMYMVN